MRKSRNRTGQNRSPIFWYVVLKYGSESWSCKCSILLGFYPNNQKHLLLYCLNGDYRNSIWQWVNHKISPLNYFNVPSKIILAKMLTMYFLFWFLFFTESANVINIHRSKTYLVPFLGFEIWKLKRLHSIMINTFEVEKPNNCILDNIE